MSEPTRPKLYVASSWRNPYYDDVIADLTLRGYEVLDWRSNGFSWSKVDPAWQTWDPQAFITALEHPIAGLGFRRDFEQMQRADACVLLLPSGRSAHIEAGWFTGAGKPVVVLLRGQNEAELMYGLADAVTMTVPGVEHALRELLQRPAPVTHWVVYTSIGARYPEGCTRSPAGSLLKHPRAVFQPLLAAECPVCGQAGKAGA